MPTKIHLSILVFFWVRALPGSPAEGLLGERATPELIAAYRERYGLDEPVYKQYWSQLQSWGHADFGTSAASHREVTDEIKERFPATAELAIAALLFAVTLGIPLGFFAAKNYGGPIDHASLFISLIGISIPVFVLGILLKYIFSVRLGWLPGTGRIDVTLVPEQPTNFYVLDAIITRDWVALKSCIEHLILPAIALGSIPLAIIARITRAAVLDVQNEDYVRTARAKGLSSLIVDRRHVLRNAALPITTIIGLQVGLLLSGAVLTETIFSWPGIGRWLAEAIFNRDYSVLQGGILFVAFVFVFVNLIVDVIYALINPRIRVS